MSFFGHFSHLSLTRRLVLNTGTTGTCLLQLVELGLDDDAGEFASCVVTVKLLREARIGAHGSTVVF